MPDDGETEETSKRGNEWEVVSLTASAYAAAPSVGEHQATGVDNNLASSEEESVRALFMSDHFVFPPSEHENLPIDYDIKEVLGDHLEEECNEPGEASGSSYLGGDGSMEYEEEDWNIKGHLKTGDMQGIKFFNEKEKNLSNRSTEFGEGNDLEGLNLAMEEGSIYRASRYSSFSDQAENSDVSKSESVKGGKGEKSEFPCEAWWKRHKIIVYSHAKGANALWSIVVAAAIVSLFILRKKLRKVAASAI